jgi:hypothetical protein
MLSILLFILIKAFLIFTLQKSLREDLNTIKNQNIKSALKLFFAVVSFWLAASLLLEGYGFVEALLQFILPEGFPPLLGLRGEIWGSNDTIASLFGRIAEL